MNDGSQNDDDDVIIGILEMHQLSSMGKIMVLHPLPLVDTVLLVGGW